MILTDDQTQALFDYMPLLQKRMGSKGTTFKNYIFSNSECAPSRATMLTGRHGNNHGINSVYNIHAPNLHGKPTAWSVFYNNGSENHTIATELRKHGYRTHMSGKYMNGYPKVFGEKGSVTRYHEKHIPPGWMDWFVVLNDLGYPEYNYNNNENGKTKYYGNESKDYNVDVVTSTVNNFISNHVSNHPDSPFFAIASFHSPHYPSIPAPRHGHLFQNDAVRDRVDGVHGPSESPNFNQLNNSLFPSRMQETCSLIPITALLYINQSYHNMLRCGISIDEAVESFYKNLEELNVLHNTFVFYTTDNGYLFGNHRILIGKNAPYEESIRGSLLVTGPNVAQNHVSNHLVGNLDLFATWMDIVINHHAYSGSHRKRTRPAPSHSESQSQSVKEIKTAVEYDGMSLMPLMLENDSSTIKSKAIDEWRQVYFLEHGSRSRGPPHKNGVCVYAGDYMTRFEGLRSNNFTYAQFTDGGEEFYDNVNDPYQLINLAHPSLNNDDNVKSSYSCHIKYFRESLGRMASCAGITCRDDWVFTFETRLQQQCPTMVVA